MRRYRCTSADILWARRFWGEMRSKTNGVRPTGEGINEGMAHAGAAQPR